MREILQALADALNAGDERLLCQVVETRGSTPQKAGAAMVIDPDGGGQVGTLGGGCVENDVKMRAIRRIGRPGAEVLSFVLDHDFAWADGLVCGGKMVVVAESWRGTGPLAYVQAQRRLIDAGSGFTEAVVIDPARVGDGVAVGSRFLFGPAGTLEAAWPPADAAPPGVAARIRPLADRPEPSARDGVATMPTLPRVRLIIVGAGHVGQAVAELAARADFDLLVVDDRADYANPARFPAGTQFAVGPFGEILPTLGVAASDFALVVTRGHGHDQEALSHLAPTPASYVGMIGSRRKIRLIFDDLQAHGLDPDALARVSAPVGLRIGSRTVFEIAVSIVAELIARRNVAP